MLAGVCAHCIDCPILTTAAYSATVKQKKAKSEALTTNKTTNTVEAQKQDKKASAEEMLEMQREEYQLYIKKLLE